ncbi:exopolyphosphatase [Adlercreutzia sp. ZJ304]|uniref:Ppx/GppA phosphatase family protein n=1 Tax=Adlercreutzia sp. ZJ304 TaxID=2709791 RepID=UPI0013ECA0E5|nr:exopolyphosphatase [Adlercreutzia sp. ZJ304]
MALFGVIDLGSNSVRLVVYKVHAGAKQPFTKKDFRNLIDEKKIAGLSAYVEDGQFTQAGIDRAAEVLDDHLRHANNIGCTNVHIFATAVLRNCENSAQVTRILEKTIGHEIDVLSERDEAHLGFVGATCDRNIEHGTLVDIGGGSTELTVIRNNTDSHCVSLGQGSVSSYAQFVNTVLPTLQETRAIEQAFAAQLDTLPSIEPYRAKRIYGIGGSVRAAAKMCGGILGNGKRLKVVAVDQLNDMLAALESSPHIFAHTAAAVAPDRLHTLVPGSIIVRTLMHALGATHLEICRFGIREGYLIERVLGGEK